MSALPAGSGSPALGGLLSRRRFVAALGTTAVASLVVRRAAAQDAQSAPVPSAAAAVAAAADSAQAQSSASNVVMDESAYRPIRREPKPAARPLLTKDDSDALEHRIGCACPCTLDVYTCRTTDFSCGISPAMHGDVQRLVAGGYSADEIIAAFVDTYGEEVLMAPKREGFNWAGYLAPTAVIGTGAVVLGALIRRWGARARANAALRPAARLDVDATPDELARLEAAVRNERS